VRELLLVVRAVAREGLPDQGAEEQRREEQRQRLLEQPAADQLCVTPTAE
jgi:hypothetical protein